MAIGHTSHIKKYSHLNQLQQLFVTVQAILIDIGYSTLEQSLWDVHWDRSFSTHEWLQLSVLIYIYKHKVLVKVKKN